MTLSTSHQPIVVCGPAGLLPLNGEELCSITIRELFEKRLKLSQGGAPIKLRLEFLETFFGLSATTLRAYCNGRSVPRDSVVELVQFSERLGITCRELVQVWLNTQDAIHGTSRQMQEVG